jgi:DNA-directed RNA polymerase subunit K/omega
MIELEMQDRMELVKEAQDVVKSRYLLCILVTQRIHQLENGAQPTIEVDADESLKNPKIFFELALREIIEGNMDLEQVTEEE